jgi:hypothetical protein
MPVSTTARVPHTRPPVSSARRPRRFDWLPVWLVAPSAVILALIVLYPVGRSLYLSLFDASLLTPLRRGLGGDGHNPDLAGNGGVLEAPFDLPPKWCALNSRSLLSPWRPHPAE